MNAVGMFIFCGSSTFGVERAGFKVNEVLEISDDILTQNAYHFAKNRNDVPIILPEEWENENGSYLLNLGKKNIDLLYSNCPCSSLSQINRNASVDGKNNVHFYRVFDGIKKSQPKAFLIENAPTLVKLGYPIIQEMVKRLGDEYKFTIIRDYAGNHNVAMQRLRTLVVGWRKDVFDNKIPLIHMNKAQKMTIKHAIGDLYNTPLGSFPNHVLHDDRDWKSYDELLTPHVPEGSSMLLTAINMFDELEEHFMNDSQTLKQIKTAQAKKEAGKNIWDKTPWRQSENKPAPSLTSVSCYIHPIHNRQWTIREYARLMGYPDSFEFDLEGGCETDIIQCLAQGVPAGFIEYIASEINEALNGNRELQDNTEDKTLTFQHHTKSQYKSFSTAELNDMTALEVDKSFDILQK